METGIKIPRLSETSSWIAWPQVCRRCGAAVELSVWQEHDDQDRRELIFVVLCRRCAERVIEPHPRLYRELDQNEPAPGVMAICGQCRHQVAGRCRSPKAAANGGPGLRFPGPDSSGFLDGVNKATGRRWGRPFRSWNREPVQCEGYEPRESE